MCGFNLCQFEHWPLTCALFNNGFRCKEGRGPARPPCSGVINEHITELEPPVAEHKQLANDREALLTWTNPLPPCQTLCVLLLSDKWGYEERVNHGCFLGTVAEKIVCFDVDMSPLRPSVFEFRGAERDEIWDSNSSRSRHPGAGEWGCLGELTVSYLLARKKATVS